MSGQLAASGSALTTDHVRPTSRQSAAGIPGRQKTAAVWALGFVVLFLAYYRLSWTGMVNSDAASNIFQVQDMLHGNVLLHGWWLSDVSFYTTELPQYALIEAVLGPVPAVIHVAAAMTYTLAILLAALVAKGRATGRAGALRMVTAAGIMLAPQPGRGVFVLDLALGHIGTSVPLLLTWLLVDRAGNRRWVPAAVGVLLAWALVADPVVLYAGIAPLIIVCGVRAYRVIVIQRRAPATARFEIALALAALAAVPVASGTLALIHALGGFTVYPIPPALVAGGAVPRHLSLTAESILTLFGADFLGLSMGLNAAGAFVHLVGLALAACAVWLVIRRFARATGHDGLAIEVMAVAVTVSITAFAFSSLSVDTTYAREIAVVLPFSAALAGRLLAGPLTSRRLLPALVAVLCGYVLTLAHGVVQPPQQTENQQMAGWLAARHFRYGLGAYWQATSVTLASGQQVQVRPVAPAPRGTVGVDPWESRASWYDPRMHDANFIVVDQSHEYAHTAPYPQVLATFGTPDRTYKVGPYLVLVWHKNLLTDLPCGFVLDRPRQHLRPSAARGCQ